MKDGQSKQIEYFFYIKAIPEAIELLYCTIVLFIIVFTTSNNNSSKAIRDIDKLRTSKNMLDANNQ